MSDRLVSFTVDHPQLEFSPHEGHFGRKNAPIWKNQASPALMLGSLNLISPETSPLRSRASPSNQTSSPKQTSAAISEHYSDKQMQNLLRQFPNYTKAHPKYIPTSPIIETFSKISNLSSQPVSSIQPNRRLCGFATNSIINRNQFLG